MEVLLFIKGCESLWNIYLSLISAAPSLSPVTLKMNTVNKTLLPFYNVVCLHCIDFEWIRNFSNPQTRCFECQFFWCFSFWSIKRYAFYGIKNIKMFFNICIISYIQYMYIYKLSFWCFYYDRIILLLRWVQKSNSSRSNLQLTAILWVKLPWLLYYSTNINLHYRLF